MVSRGVRVAYTKGAFSAALEGNDGFYTGKLDTLEGIVGYSARSGASLQLAFIIPPAGAAGNATASVTNKTEYDLMYAQTEGKLQLTPYLLLAHSPASTVNGFARSESAMAAILMGTYAFDSAFSLSGRYENVANGSSAADASANADFLGYGRAARRLFTARAEYSIVSSSSAARQTREGFRTYRSVLATSAECGSFEMRKRASGLQRAAVELFVNAAVPLNIGNTAFMLICASLVMLMTQGLAFFFMGDW